MSTRPTTNNHSIYSNKRLRNALALLALALMPIILGGCISLTSWAHNKRHVKQMWNEFEGLHEDFDRIIFGLERNPAE